MVLCLKLMDLLVVTEDLNFVEDLHLGSSSEVDISARERLKRLDHWDQLTRQAKMENRLCTPRTSLWIWALLASSLLFFSTMYCTTWPYSLHNNLLINSVRYLWNDYDDSMHQSLEKTAAHVGNSVLQATLTNLETTVWPSEGLVRMNSALYDNRTLPLHTLAVPLEER